MLTLVDLICNGGLQCWFCLVGCDVECCKVCMDVLQRCREIERVGERDRLRELGREIEIETD